MTHNAISIFLSDKRPFIGSDVYRILLPFEFINEGKKINATWAFYGEMLTKHRQGIFDWNKLMEEMDIFIFPRAFVVSEESETALVHLFSELRRMGKKVVYELDDDLSNEYREVGSGDLRPLLPHVDLVTVTTEALKNRMLEIGATSPIKVLPNSLNPRMWKRNHFKDRSDNLVIGLTGSPTHYNDWIVLMDVLPKIVEKYPDVRIVTMGFNPPYLHDIKNTIYSKGVPYKDYPQVIKSFDIVLAPVDPTDKFNWSKSPLKLIEGMGAVRRLDGTLAGAAVIASDSVVYSPYVTNREHALIVNHDEDSWFDGISEVIEDTKLRNSLQKSGFRHAWKNFDMSKTYVKWVEAYEDMFNAVQVP